VNHCALFKLRRDALHRDRRGRWLLSAPKARAGRWIAHLIRHEEIDRVREVYDFGLSITDTLVENAREPLRNDYFLYRTRRGHGSHIKSNSEIYTTGLPCNFKRAVREFFQSCSIATGISFEGLDTRNLRATSIRRMLAEEEHDLIRTARRAGKSNPISLRPYIGLAAEKVPARRQLRHLQSIADHLYEQASLHFNMHCAEVAVLEIEALAKSSYVCTTRKDGR
jgi:hypothetical protein